MEGIFPRSLFSKNENDIYNFANLLPGCRLLNDKIIRHDPHTYYHSSGVAKLMLALTLRSDFGKIASTDSIIDFTLAGQMHDIGKIHIDKNILNSTGVRLADDEWQIIKQHPIVGFAINNTTFTDRPMVGNIALVHHTLQKNSYPAQNLVNGLASLKTNDDVELLGVGAAVVTIADQSEARIPIPKLNSHPYADRSGYTCSELIDSVRSELAKSPNLLISKKLLDQLLEISEDILSDTIAYHISESPNSELIMGIPRQAARLS
jgi:hypothetical protein